MKYPCKDCIVMPVCREMCPNLDTNNFIIIQELLLNKCCIDCGHNHGHSSTTVLDSDVLHIICDNCLSRYQSFINLKTSLDERIFPYIQRDKFVGIFKDVKSDWESQTFKDYINNFLIPEMESKCAPMLLKIMKDLRGK
jgi:hypothetical protein